MFVIPNIEFCSWIQHLIPNLLEEHGLKQDRVSFSDEAILSIIRSYTKESGVRELDRLLATIIRKIVKDIVVNKAKDNYKITVSNVSKYNLIFLIIALLSGLSSSTFNLRQSSKVINL